MRKLAIRIMWDEGADQSLGLPAYESEGAAGADLRANLPDRGELELAPGSRALVPTGCAWRSPRVSRCSCAPARAWR